MEKRLTVPLTTDDVINLRVGDMVLLSGTIYTARDAAHKRMCEQIDAGEQLPFDFDGQIVYYAGPCPAKPGKPIGSVGPTTSGRMDAYSPKLIEEGLRFMIGKGKRNTAVVESIKAHKGIYFIAIGGAAAYMAQCVTKSEQIAYLDLGTESVKKLEVVDLPVLVAIDADGNSIY